MSNVILAIIDINLVVIKSAINGIKFLKIDT